LSPNVRDLIEANSPRHLDALDQHQTARDLFALTVPTLSEQERTLIATHIHRSGFIPLFTKQATPSLSLYPQNIFEDAWDWTTDTVEDAAESVWDGFTCAFDGGNLYDCASDVLLKGAASAVCQSMLPPGPLSAVTCKALVHYFPPETFLP
jgi:hypothetical protein